MTSPKILDVDFADQDEVGWTVGTLSQRARCCFYSHETLAAKQGERKETSRSFLNSRRS